MTAKDLMRSIRPLRRELELLRQQERAMLSPQAITYDKVRVQTSPQDRMFETVEAIQKLGDLIQRKEKELAEMQLEAMTLIYSLDKTDYRQLLILYYIDGDESKIWNDVADAMGYSESRVKHLHGWALDEIERKIKDSDARRA